MSPLTILRIEKLKTFGNVAGSDDHVTRNRETPNADPTKENVRLIGGEDDRSLEEIVKEKISTLKHRPRHDAVLCTEMFLSASPEYFRPKDPSLSGQWSDSLMQQWASASRDWLAQNYGSKCVRAELHLDESTPHIHAYIVPLNDKTGRVSHDAMFGGRGGQGRIKLSKLQDSYAAALAPLGIERGVKGSKATHTKVKEYYQAVNSEPLTAVITNNQLAPTPFESASSYVARIQSDEHFQAINHQLADRSFMAERLERAEQRARDSEKERQRLEEIVRELELKTQQLRDLALEDVAWELGLHHDEGKWRGHGHIINIDGPKFYDFAPDQQKGSGGAIDLVMHVNQCNLRQAVVWLHERFGSAGAERAAIAFSRQVAAEIIQLEPRDKFRLPVEDKAKWQAVSNYLTQKRGIPSNFVEVLHKRGLVYADDQQKFTNLWQSKRMTICGSQEKNEIDNELGVSYVYPKIGHTRRFKRATLEKQGRELVFTHDERGEIFRVAVNRNQSGKLEYSPIYIGSVEIEDIQLWQKAERVLQRLIESEQQQKRKQSKGISLGDGATRHLASSNSRCLPLPQILSGANQFFAGSGRHGASPPRS